MTVPRDDFLVIAYLLTDYPARDGIHSAQNTYFGRKDECQVVEDYYQERNLRTSPWHNIIANTLSSGTKISDADAETIREVMNEFHDGEMIHTEIWK